MEACGSGVPSCSVVKDLVMRSAEGKLTRDAGGGYTL